MTHRILVLGAGYAGMMAAGRLGRHLLAGDVSITMINATERFVERVRLHQLAVGQRLDDHRIDQMLRGSGVGLVTGRITDIDLHRREVRVRLPGEERSFTYDTLVYALGSTHVTGGPPGTAEHGHEVSTLAGALRLRKALKRLDSGGVVTVVGGGMTGIEAATELAESRPELKVRIVSDGAVGGWLSPGARRRVDTSLSRLGISVRSARVARLHEDGPETEEGTRLHSDLTIWTTGFGVPSMADHAGLSTDPDGRILVDSTMRSLSHQRVYAVGDAAAVTGPHGSLLRMACGTGIPMAIQAADAIAARLVGRRPHRFVFRYVHHAISLGRRDAVIQFVNSDDSPKRAMLKGAIAVRYKEFVCRWAIWLLKHPGPYLRRHTPSGHHTTTADAAHRQ